MSTAKRFLPRSAGGSRLSRIWTECSVGSCDGSNSSGAPKMAACNSENWLSTCVQRCSSTRCMGNFPCPCSRPSEKRSPRPGAYHHLVRDDKHVKAGRAVDLEPLIVQLAHHLDKVEADSRQAQDGLHEHGDVPRVGRGVLLGLCQQRQAAAHWPAPRRSAPSCPGFVPRRVRRWAWPCAPASAGRGTSRRSRTRHSPRQRRARPRALCQQQQCSLSLYGNAHTFRS